MYKNNPNLFINLQTPIRQMLRFSKLLIACCFITFSSSAFAQRAVIKLNAPSLALGSISGSLEVGLTDFMSLSAGVAVLRNRSLDLSQANIDRLDYNLGGNPNIEGFSTTLDVRFYPSRDKEVLSGFYVGPFIRYYKYEGAAPYIYEEQGQRIETDGFAELSAVGGGVVLGTQWIIAKHFAIDFFFGVGVGAAEVDASVTESSLTAADYALIRDRIEEDLIGSDLEAYTTYASDQDAGVQVSFLAPILRGGLAFGVAF